MNNSKKYRDSLLSALCVISWFVIVFRIFNSAKDDSAFKIFIWTYLTTIVVGIFAGIVLLLIGTLSKRKLKHSFMYNFFGTLNIIVGFLGLLLPRELDKPFSLYSYCKPGNRCSDVQKYLSLGKG